MMARIRGTAVPVLAGLALVLSFLPAALAHGGDEEAGMDMGHGHGDSAAPKPAEDSYPETYFSHPELQGVLYAHIGLMVLGWVFMLPVAVMFSLARSRYTFALQLVFGITNAVGLIVGMIYNEGTPDLYPGNAHHKLGWAVSAIFCAQVAVGVLGRLVGALSGPNIRRSGAGEPGNHERRSFIPVSAEAMAEHQRASNAATKKPYYRFSNDSGQGTEPNTESLRSPSSSSSRLQHDDEVASRKDEEYGYDDEYEYEDRRGHADEDDNDDHDGGDDGDYLGRHRRLTPAARAYRMAMRAAGLVSSRAWKVLAFGYNLVDRVILILGFVAICTGVITQGRLFEGHEIFSGLAHWIKGGVFFWLGVVTLGRWTGAFGELGWAWNVRPRRAGQGWRPSAEFVESALIFFYGSTNIFLEHLGSAGGAWSSQDLEHVSITVLFIGGGLCGMLVESAWVRDLLNTTVVEAVAHDDAYPDDKQPPRQQMHRELELPKQYGVSLNPIPALVILLLGIMMSSHTQTNMISSMVHKQWGNLLTGASFARGFTYVLMYLKPPRSVLPSRPPTELLASFGLTAGGIIFMASSGDTVAGMIHQDLDAMFMYTVTMGLVALLMAWIVIVMALKGWAVRREARRRSGSYRTA